MSNPAPGWYPAPHANGEQRYWDGAQWQEPVRATGYPGAVTPAAKPARGLAIAALIVGIVAFLMGLLPVIGVVLGLAAVALGAIALMKKQPKGLAITGLALGSVALLVSVATTAGVVNLANNRPERPTVESTQPAQTPSEEPVETPSAEREPEAPPAPLVARQEFAGTGDMVLDVNISEVAIISFSCGDCNRNTVLKTNGQDSLLVNTIGAYTGSHLVNIYEGSIITQLIVESTGNWSLVVDDLSTAPVGDTAASGTGDAVVVLTGDVDAAAITNDAGGNFVVKAYGDGNFSPLIVNTIGAYSGTVQMTAPAIVQVNSEGNWTITGQ